METEIAVPVTPDSLWYVLQTKVGRDDRVVEEFPEGDAYSPVGSKVVIHKRYKTRLHKDFRLFPSYVFVREASDGVVTREVKRAGARKFLGPVDRPYSLPFGYVEHLRNEELLGAFDSRKRPEIGDKIRVELFGVELDAEVIRSPADTINAIAKLMGRIVTITDCAGKLVPA